MNWKNFFQPLMPLQRATSCPFPFAGISMAVMQAKRPRRQEPKRGGGEKALRKSHRKLRPCLLCERRFYSSGPANRVCPDCAKKKSWR